jgi:diguanylate cyclase (GGDEF)-like protein
MDTVSRPFSDREARMLTSLAGLLVGDWVLRQQAQKSALQHQALEQSHGWLLESVSQDPLTQVANRRALMAFLDKTLALARRESQPLAVLLFDICGFKDINAEYGDASGDRVLADVAGRLSDGARGSELVGRMAGDEFMAVLYPCTPEQAALAAERFAASVQAQPVSLGPVVQIAVSLAVGVCATDPTDDLTPDELYRRAAHALDTAKEAQGLSV